MARTFTLASSEKITLSLGALGFAFGPGTIALIIRSPATFTNGAVMFSAGSSTTVGYRLSNSGTAGKVQLVCNSSAAANPTTNLAASGWNLVAVTKATGTAAPRFHFYTYSTNVFVHENSATSIANASAPTTSAAFAATQGGAASFWSGDIAVAGVWNVVLADQDIESLAFSLPPWLANNPKGLWVLDQAAVAQLVPDLSGGGANQSAITGTAVSANSVPVWTPYGTFTNH
jgi:hypothetical protein